ncbi:hypothetical protein pb186bvf_000166 [Paramecium bursaria]
MLFQSQINAFIYIYLEKEILISDIRQKSLTTMSSYERNKYFR